MLPRQRAYSIRTRIKTGVGSVGQSVLLPVREHIPLEQGLRLLAVFSFDGFTEVREHIPLEQGLRQRFFVHTF